MATNREGGQPALALTLLWGRFTSGLAEESRNGLFRRNDCGDGVDVFDVVVYWNIKYDTIYT